MLEENQKALESLTQTLTTEYPELAVTHKHFWSQLMVQN